MVLHRNVCAQSPVVCVAADEHTTCQVQDAHEHCDGHEFVQHIRDGHIVQTCVHAHVTVVPGEEQLFYSDNLECKASNDSQ